MARKWEYRNKLAKCMQEARESGTAHPEWPRFAFVLTTPTHFDTPDGFYDSKSRHKPCLKTTRGGVLQQMEDEIREIGDLLPIVAKNSTELAALTLGHLHVGGKGDCTHWIQPGVGDLILKEMIEWVREQIETVK